MEPFAIAVRALASIRPPSRMQPGRAHHRGNDLAIRLNSHQRAERLNPARKLFRAVDWIDDHAGPPRSACGLRIPAAHLFTQNVQRQPARRHFRPRHLFYGAIRLRHCRPVTLSFNSQFIRAEIPHRNRIGLLRDPFDPVALAQTLESAGASALSVLTEGEFFRGSLKNLRDARKSVQLPVLRKDFIFDPWQVWETRASDADSFLLIVATLEDGLLRDLIALGRELGMEPLVEVHTGEELDRALTAGARILGVNNRDLKTLTVRVEASFELIGRIPDDCIAVSESGLRTHDDLVKLRAAGFDAFLVGTHLMLSPDPAAALSALLTGTPEVK